MAGMICPVSSSTLPRISAALKQLNLRNATGSVSVSSAAWSSRAFGQPLVQTSTQSRQFVCNALNKDQLDKAKKFQLQATEVLAELLKSSNVQSTAAKLVDSLTEEFFMVASTYFEMKEGNAEVMKRIEGVLEVAMAEKGKTLRPEIQLMNKLLNEKDQGKRAETMRSYSQYITDSDGYFYELLQRMNNDVEGLKDSPKKQELLGKIRTVTKEVKETGRAFRKAK
uniref:Uncharacterized protein n=1 Tax=Physcomitrium patens TaxID=3218 RepID=A0A7I4F6G5_PHYPA